MNETYYLEGSNGDLIEFDDENYAILRESITGLSGMPVEYDVSHSPGFIGGSVQSVSVLEREVSLQVAVMGAGREAIEELRARLIAALNPLHGDSKFHWRRANGDDYYLRVRPDSSYPAFTTGTDSSPKHWDCDLTLICHDPCWYSNEEIQREFVKPDDGFKLPVQFPFTLGNRVPTREVINNGTLPTPMHIEFHGQIRAPITLTNTTSGKSMTIRRDIAEGETLTINTSQDDIFVTVTNDETGETTNALYYCTIGSQFWQLEPGLNVIEELFAQVYDSASGILTYRERYIGI